MGISISSLTKWIDATVCVTIPYPLPSFSSSQIQQ